MPKELTKTELQDKLAKQDEQLEGQAATLKKLNDRIEDMEKNRKHFKGSGLERNKTFKGFDAKQMILNRRKKGDTRI